MHTRTNRRVPPGLLLVNESLGMIGADCTLPPGNRICGTAVRFRTYVLHVLRG